MFIKKLVSSGMLCIYMTSICIAQAVELTLPIPTDIIVTPAETSATLTFTTSEVATSSVAYGTSESYELPPVTGASATAHSLLLEGLTCETTYHYQITTTNELNNTAQTPDQTFVTSSCPVPVDPPVAPSNTALTDILVTPAETSATLTFTTSEVTTSSVAYGTTVSYELPPVTGASATAHSLLLEGLTCETTYHYQITTTNELNNTAQTGDQTFVTGSCRTPVESTEPSFDPASTDLWTLSPVDGATGVSRTANFVMTFSEVVSAGTGNIVIKKISDNSTVESIDVTSGQVTGGGTNTITINPGITLEGSTDYYIQVDAGALQDALNNPFAGIADNSTWNFTTVTLSTPTLIVNSLLDDGVGTCTEIKCTLRDAIYTANNNANADNIIQFGNLSGTLVVTTSSPITSNKNLTIQGPGSDTLTVDFNNNTNNSITQSGGNLTVSGLTFTKNNYNAFYVTAPNKTFTLSDSVVTGNPSKSAVNIKTGAAIVVNINNTLFSNNTGANQGGAIFNSSSGSNMTITNSTFSGNTTIAQGGAVYTSNVITTINKSSFSGNRGSLGGAIFTTSSARLLSVTNSTFYNNTITNNGSMIEAGTPTNIKNSTFVDTVSTSGYGIYINSSSSVVNSIFYSNNGGYSVCGGSLTSSGHNIDSGTSCGLAGTGDQSSTDPLLSPSWLVNNGGAVKTIAILTGSPAKNAGDNGLAPVTDAREYARSGIADIGAYEYQDGGDIAKPIITTFTIPATSSSLTIDITSLVATDAGGVTGYMLTEVNTEPALGNANWTLSAPTTYTFATEGAKTLYAWAKDASGNISASSSAPVTITLPPDITKPVISNFTIPATLISLTVDITSLVATDNIGVTGYMLTEVNTEPALGNANWTLSAPTEYTFATEGAKTLYAWAKDAAGNISLSASDQVVITLSPRLTYDGAFTETIANDGSVTGSRYATLVNDTFAHPDTTLTEGVDYTIFNKPAGLSAVMVVNGEGTIATLTFTGKATNHTAADRATNLTITFLDGAFTDTPIASDVLGYTNSDSDSDVTFNDATVIVNSLLDDGLGTCTELKCTFRDAVATAQPNDTIQFGNLSGTIVLTNHNPITITQDLIIEGPGASNLTIDFDNDGNTYIDQEGGNLTISGLTLTHAPYNAVYMDFPSASFTLNNSVVANNTAEPAIQAQSIGFVTINNSTFYNNTSGFFSAALYSLASVTTINNSTFYDNHGKRSGAVYIEAFDGTATFTNSTFYNNTSIEGYSMFETDTFMTNITNSTFVDTISTGSSATAGISIDHASHVTNSLFYSNPSNPGYKVCNTSIGSFGHNIDSANSCGLSQVTTDLISTDPLLDLGTGLHNNGGSVQTIAFLANSPARDNGTNVYTPATDARGYMRVGVTDIGAYEYPDTIKPVINPFTIPETSNSLTVPITALVATDNVRVTGYILTLVDVEPALNDVHWSASVPTEYAFVTEGTKTLYAWARDAAGNVSVSVSDQVTITTPVTVTCEPSAISAFADDPISWTAVPSGGDGTGYTYEWTGDDGLTGTDNPLAKTYTTIGVKTATVVARSGGLSSEPTTCTTTISARPPGRGGGPTFSYGCTDPNALNYTRNVLSRSSMCRYAPGITPTIPVVPNIPPTLDSAPNNFPLCSARIYPTKYIRFGRKNDPEQVTLLEQYLTIFEGESLPIDGLYSREDEAAVVRWQENYRSDILTPWGESQGTGYVFITSLRKFKELFEAQCKKDTNSEPDISPFFTRDLSLGMEGDDVRKLQEILIKKATGKSAQDLARVGVTGYFGPLTKRSLIEFQKVELLNPANGEMGIITIYLLTE